MKQGGLGRARKKTREKTAGAARRRGDSAGLALRCALRCATRPRENDDSKFPLLHIQ
jgi:hypothetical protein